MKHAYQTQFDQYMDRARRLIALNRARWQVCAWFSALGIGAFGLSLGLNFNDTVDCVAIGGAVSALLLAIRFILQRISHHESAEYLDKCLKNTHLARTCLDLYNTPELNEIEENTFKTTNSALSSTSLWPPSQYNWRICLALGAVTMTCAYGIHSLRLGYMPTIEVTPSNKTSQSSSTNSNKTTTPPKLLRPSIDAVALTKTLEESPFLDEKTKEKLRQWRSSLNAEGGEQGIKNSLVDKLRNLVDISNVIDKESPEAKALLNQQVDELIKQAFSNNTSNGAQQNANNPDNTNTTGQHNSQNLTPDKQSTATTGNATGQTHITTPSDDDSNASGAKIYRGQHKLDSYQQSVLKRYFK